MSLICGIWKYDTNELFHRRKKKTENIIIKGKSEGIGEDKLRVWNEQIHTTMHETYKQQEPTV